MNPLVDLVATNSLILSHLWIVVSVASSLKRRFLFSADWDELISVGNLALVKAAHGLEGQNGCQFRTYAYKFVRGEMIKSFTRVDGHHGSAMLGWVPLEEADTLQPPDQVEKFYAREMKHRLLTAVGELKPQHQATITAEFYGEQPLTQVARNWGFKRDRVMKWKRTSLKQLREALSGVC